MSFKDMKKGKMACFLGGIAVATAGAQILKSDKTRDACVKGLAKGMVIQNNAQTTFQNMKEEAEDICHDAKKKAGAGK